MRPVLLELDGFCSYRTPAKVDFRDTDFFVLVGPTGSGKSTIIDAMVFALYGTVPRWDDRNAVAPALAPSAVRGVVRLIFDVAGERYAALRDIRRSGGRNPTVTVREARLEQFVSRDAVGDEQDEVISLATGRAVTKTVENLLGLSFEQFTQSVALPQGEFAQFLHSTDAQRQDILENLLGYQIYDEIMRAANSRASEKAQRAETLGEQLAGYADATQNAVDEFNHAFAGLRELQQHVTTQAVPALTAAAQSAAQVRNLVEQLCAEREQILAVEIPTGLEDLEVERGTKQGALDAALADQTAIEERDRQARTKLQAAPARHEIEQVLSHWEELTAIAAALPALSDAVTSTDTDLSGAEAKRSASVTALSRARAATTDADREAERHERAAAEAHAHLDALLAVSRPGDLDNIVRAIRDCADQLSAGRADLAGAEAQQKAAAERVSQLPNAEMVATARNSINELRRILADDIAAASERTTALAELSEVRAKALAANDKVSAAETALHTAEHANRVATIRAELMVGDNCPVCGNEITEQPTDIDVTDVDSARTAMNAAKTRAADVADELTQLERNHASTLAVRTEQLRRCEPLRAHLMEDLTTIGLDGDCLALWNAVDERSSDDALVPVLAEATLVASQLTAAVSERRKLEEQRRTAEDTLQSARDEVQRLEDAASTAQAGASSARTALRESRDSVAALDPPAIDDSDVHSGWEQLTAWVGVTTTSLRDRVAQLSTTESDARDNALRLQKELGRAEELAEAAGERHTNAARAKEKADEQLRTATQRQAELNKLLSGAPAADEVRALREQVIALQAEVDEATAALMRARQATSAAQAALNETMTTIEASWRQLQRARDPLTRFGIPEVRDTGLASAWQLVADWCASEASSRLAQIEVAEAEAAKADESSRTAESALISTLAGRGISVPSETTGAALASEAIGLVAAAVAKAAATRDRAQERLSESEKLRSQVKETVEQGEVARTLANLMRANNFPRWLIGSAIDALLEDASRILLELSGGQFELTRDQRDLLVIDHNDADMSRPVKTLSGGETFQASLALALALSEQVTSLSAAGASKLESIFLDEGFGTLDETTLDVVASTLENLASSGSRMVGVITHVGALAERIPVRFQVTRDNAGSHIEKQRL
jgi:exonuclease SbcC